MTIIRVKKMVNTRKNSRKYEIICEIIPALFILFPGKLCFMRMIKKILFVTTISGFVPQFEMNDVKIMQDMGYEVHYASNFTKQVYSFDQQKLVDHGINLHSYDI